MIARRELRKIARARLKDAEKMYAARRYDVAVYICGYAVEVALKARICRTLRWSGFPENNSEFKGYQSLRTHDLDTLLGFTGIDNKIQAHYHDEWSTVSQWGPDLRYRRIGETSAKEAKEMIALSQELLRALS